MDQPCEDFYYLIKHGRNEHCDKLLAEVAKIVVINETGHEEKMTEGEGNYYFCKESELAKKVMREEVSIGRVLHPAEEAPWLGQSHRWRCDHWFRLHKKTFEKAGVKSSADVRRLEDARHTFPMLKTTAEADRLNRAAYDFFFPGLLGPH